MSYVFFFERTINIINNIRNTVSVREITDLS
jgi:hypothetical protein